MKIRGVNVIETMPKNVPKLIKDRMGYIYQIEQSYICNTNDDAEYLKRSLHQEVLNYEKRYVRNRNIVFIYNNIKLN